MKFLITLDWLLWSILLIALFYALITMLTDQSARPETAPTLGVFLIVLGLAFSVATGSALHWLAQKQSLPGMVLMSFVLAWPLVPVIARPLTLAYKDWKHTPGKSSRENLSIS